MARQGARVAVTGATGRQGAAVVRHLLAEGWTVRALTRRPGGEPARTLAGLGAEVVRVDMMDGASLLPAFAGTHGVYSVQNPLTSSPEHAVIQGRNVADAAKQVGVRHVVFGSAGPGVPDTGVGSWDSKLVVEAHMSKIRLPVTVLRPMAFMELMTDKAYFPAVAAWSVMPRLMGAERQIPWLSVDDLGAIAARVFADPHRYIGADLKLASDVRSVAECRELWREITGRPPRRFPMPTWLFQRFTGTDLTSMWTWLRTRDPGTDPARTYEILPGARTVREWLISRQRGRSGLPEAAP